MKKAMALLVSLLMVVAMAACSSNVTPSTSAGESVSPSAGESAAASVSPSEAASSTNETASGSKGKIGVLLPSLAMDFQTKMAAGVKRAADEFGYDYQEIDYNFDAELEASGMDTLASTGVQAYYGIFMSAEADSARLKDHPEIGTISQAMDVESNAFIVNDYQAMGEQYIESLKNFRTTNNLKGGDMASIWLTTCEVKDSDYYDAMTTMKSTMLEYCQQEGLNYVSDQYAETDEDASNIAEQLLNAYPNLRYIFCFNNGYALVTANEISSAVTDSSDYFVFSSEGDDESFRLISSKESPLRGCAYQDIEKCGYQTGLQLINWIKTGKMENVVANRVLVDIRNVADYLK